MSSFPVPTGSLKAGEHELRFECDVLGEQYETRALNELRESPEVVQDAIAALVQLIKEDEELVVPYDEEWLLYQYLRPCKFYPTSALKRLRNFYRFRAKNHKLCKDLIPSKNKTALLEKVLTFLPYRDQHGRRILVIEAGRNWKPSVVSLNEIWRALMLFLDVGLMEPRTQVSGAIIIFDLSGLSMSHVFQITPSFAKNFLEWVQGCIPLRLKATHFVNQPLVFNIAYAIFKPFIGEKLRNRLYFHGEDRASLLQHIDAKCVPERYGGDLEFNDFPREELFDLFCKYEDLFEERLTFGYTKEKKSS